MIAFPATPALIQTPDAVLVARLKLRERSAWEELVVAHGARLQGVALRYMRNQQDAEDVLQDALLVVWNKIETFEGRSAFHSWLYRVTANTALMALRSRQRQSNTLSLDALEHDCPDICLAPNASADQPDAKVLRAELSEQMRFAITQLGGQHRTVILMRDVDGFSMTEIAAATGLSLPTIKSRLHRARIALRQILFAYFAGAPALPSSK